MTMLIFIKIKLAAMTAFREKSECSLDLSSLHHLAKNSRTARILVCIVLITAGVCRMVEEPVMDHIAFLQHIVKSSIHLRLKATLDTVDL